MLTSLPPRTEQLRRLREESFDIVIIGGGATGTGIAVDGATRGLSVALVEADDFASKTSSRSTKLIHGGVRYLEKAISKLDRKHFHLVKEALHERKTLLENAPHLTRTLPIITPLYRLLEAPYYFAGLKLYDWISGSDSLGSSHFLSKTETLKRLPMLNRKGLKGGVLYYDGQFDDARLNVALALTSAYYGAAIANHIEVKKIEGNRITVVDALDGESWTIEGKIIINATGPQADRIRKMADPTVDPLLKGSVGTHLLLNNTYSSPSCGMIIPKTSDGRVIFLLPWEGGTLAGTTETKIDPAVEPQPTAEEITYLLDHLSPYLNVPLAHKDILAVWSGTRPLLKQQMVSTTSDIYRGHKIEVGKTGLISILGGKWTTYRKMAEDTVDQAITQGRLKPLRPCQTERTKLVGAMEKEYTPITKHLTHAYGDRAQIVAKIANQGYDHPLAKGYPYIEAEVIYGVDHEYACTAADILARRTRLAFLDAKATEQALPKVIEIMAEKLHWSPQRCQQEINDVKENYCVCIKETNPSPVGIDR